MRKIQGVLCCLIILIATSSHAQRWTGAVDSDWNNPGNWSFGIGVVIPSTAANWPILNSNVTSYGLFMEPGSKINLNGYTLEASSTPGQEMISLNSVTIEGPGTLLMKGSGEKYFNGNTINGNLGIVLEGSLPFLEAATAPNVYNGNISFSIPATGDFELCSGFPSEFHGSLHITRYSTGNTLLFRKGFTGELNDLIVRGLGALHSGLTINEENLPVPAIGGRIEINMENSFGSTGFLMRGITNNTPGGFINVSAVNSLDYSPATILYNSLQVDSVSVRNFNNGYITGNVFHSNFNFKGGRMGGYNFYNNKVYGKTNIILTYYGTLITDRNNEYFDDVKMCFKKVNHNRGTT